METEINESNQQLNMEHFSSSPMSEASQMNGDQGTYIVPMSDKQVKMVKAEEQRNIELEVDDDGNMGRFSPSPKRGMSQLKAPRSSTPGEGNRGGDRSLSVEDRLGSLRNSAVAHLLVEGRLPDELSSAGEETLLTKPMDLSSKKSLSPETDDGTGCTGQDGRTVRRSKRRRTETAASIASKAQQLLQCQFCSFVAEDKIMLYSHYQFHQQMMSNQQQIRNKPPGTHAEWLAAYQPLPSPEADEMSRKEASPDYKSQPALPPCTGSPTLRSLLVGGAPDAQHTASGFLRSIVHNMVKQKSDQRQPATSIYNSLLEKQSKANAADRSKDKIHNPAISSSSNESANVADMQNTFSQNAADNSALYYAKIEPDWEGSEDHSGSPFSGGSSRDEKQPNHPAMNYLNIVPDGLSDDVSRSVADNTEAEAKQWTVASGRESSPSTSSRSSRKSMPRKIVYRQEAADSVGSDTSVHVPDYRYSDRVASPASAGSHNEGRLLRQCLAGSAMSESNTRSHTDTAVQCTLCCHQDTNRLPKDSSVQCNISHEEQVPVTSPSTSPLPADLTDMCTTVIGEAQEGQMGQHLQFIKCPHCNVTFDDAVLHSIHMGCHSHKDPFICNVCGKPCGNKYGFYTHIMRGHTVNDSE